MIKATSGKLHWNYFLALEKDIEVVSRYVEFCEANFDVYSIEFAHILFAAASEVDAVAKLLCQQLKPNAPRNKIDDYAAILCAALADLTTTQVSVPRYGLILTPWDNWAGAKNPVWWRSYNNVKHDRDVHFQEATLKNALNALGALLILVYHHYSYSLAPSPGQRLSPKITTQQLEPESTLLRLQGDYYYDHIVG
jgi:hypothetical protein